MSRVSKGRLTGRGRQSGPAATLPAPAAERPWRWTDGVVTESKSDLYLGSLKVGVITTVDEDFLNLRGSIELDPAFDEPSTSEHARFLEFVALHRECTRLVDVSHEQDVSDALAVVNARLDAYLDYIDAAEWHLVDAAGRRLPILCPIFRGPNEIVWRWGA